jgi:predicted tellurium resistance membrane protein TerC
MQTGMTFLHFGALLFAGGYAVASDRWVLRSQRAAALHQNVVLDELADIHRPVVIGIAVLVATGLAMALADADTLLVSRVFWIKMGCFALLLVNGLTLRNAESHLRAVELHAPEAARWWKRLRGSALRSISLWLLTVLLGTLLTSAS